MSSAEEKLKSSYRRMLINSAIDEIERESEPANVIIIVVKTDASDDDISTAVNKAASSFALRK